MQQRFFQRDSPSNIQFASRSGGVVRELSVPVCKVMLRPRAASLGGQYSPYSSHHCVCRALTEIHQCISACSQVHAIAAPILRRGRSHPPPHQTWDKLQCVSDCSGKRGRPGREAAPSSRTATHVSTLHGRGRPQEIKICPAQGPRAGGAGDQASDDSRVLTTAITTAGRPPNKKRGAAHEEDMYAGMCMCRQTGGFPVWRIDRQPNPAVAARGSPGSRRAGNLDKREPRPISLRRLVGASSSRQELHEGGGWCRSRMRSPSDWLDGPTTSETPPRRPLQEPVGTRDWTLLPARRKPPSLPLPTA